MVQFDTSEQRLAALATDCLAIGMFDEEVFSGTAQAIDAATRGLLRRLKSAGDLPVRAGETQLLLSPTGLKASRLLVVGLGKRPEFRQRGWRKAVSAALAAALRTRAARLALAIDQPQADPVDAYYLGRAVADLTGTALYRINDFKTARKPPRPALKRVALAGLTTAQRRQAQRGLVHGQAIAA
ncbi:MAG TPA: M17 family peptidase N-terminal domain-containing protein, partial [Steroidobacteraceae bacterium]|nr:M17 family peptidase N-terminal domain-containing protein [Steroidobacteraceae bacterium]